MKFSSKWMELENILSEATQSQKYMHGMHSLTSGPKPGNTQDNNSQTT
jgi:fructoselysine-6-P-deglycase FrlB-like protein